MAYKTTESVLIAFVTQVLASSDVTAIIGQRLFFSDANETPTLPYSVCRMEGSSITRHHSGQGGIEEVEVELGLYASTPTEALQLRDTIVEHLKGFSGTSNGTQLHRINYEGQSDDNDPQSKVFGYLLDFTVTA
jgi:hypothetical protein